MKDEQARTEIDYLRRNVEELQKNVENILLLLHQDLGYCINSYDGNLVTKTEFVKKDI